MIQKTVDWWFVFTAVHWLFIMCLMNKHSLLGSTVEWSQGDKFPASFTPKWVKKGSHLLQSLAFSSFSPPLCVRRRSQHLLPPRVGAQYHCIKKMWWERRDWVTKSSVLRPEWDYKELMIRTPAESPVFFYAYCLFEGWDLTEGINEEHAHISGIVTRSQKCLILKKKKIKWRWGIFSQFSVLIIRIDLSC